MKFTKPRCLKLGDVVGVISPSDYTKEVDRRNEVDVDKSVEILESWGLKVKLGKHVFAADEDFHAGTLNQRKADFLWAATDPEIRAIWPTCGGFSSFDIIDYYSKEIMPEIKKHRKILVGYSDITLFQNLLFKDNYVSIYGPNLSGIYSWSDRSRNYLKNILFTGYPHGEEDCTKDGCDTKIKLEIAKPSAEPVNGVLQAINLSTYVECFGTPFDSLASADFPLVLALEDVKLLASDIRRNVQVLLHHKSSKRIKAIILGRFVGSNDPDYPEWSAHHKVAEIFSKHIGEPLGIPILQNEQWGHSPKKSEEKEYTKVEQSRFHTFLPLPSGVHVELHARGAEGKLILKDPILNKE